jgi:chromosomal replication initiator protein
MRSTIEHKAHQQRTRAAVKSDVSRVGGGGWQAEKTVALYIAQNASANVRELEGCLTRLAALASMRKTAITTDFAQQALHDLIRTHEIKPDIEFIQRTVSDFFHIRLVCGELLILAETLL